MSSFESFCACEALEGRTFLAAGSPVLSFGVNGIVTTDLTGAGTRDTVLASAAIPGGDTFVLAQVEDGRAPLPGVPSIYTARSSPLLLRYLSSGKLDQELAGTGALTAPAGIVHVAADETGRAYLTGFDHDSIFVYRYLSNGRIDRTFGKSGRALIPLSLAFGASTQVMPDGSVYVEARRERSIAIVARLSSRGRLDRTFGTNGIMRLPGMYWQNWTRTFVQDDGSVLTFQLGQGKPVATRLLRTGRIDRSFGTTGKVTVTSLPDDVALLPDGGFITAEHGQEHPGATGVSSCSDTTPYDVLMLRRYDSRGRINKRFGTGARAIYRPAHGDASSSALSIQSDGKLVVSLWESAPPPDVLPPQPGDQSLTIVRFTTAGRLDASYGTAGHVSPVVAKHDDSGSALDAFIRRNGDVMVIGNTDGDVFLGRFSGK